MAVNGPLVASALAIASGALPHSAEARIAYSATQNGAGDIFTIGDDGRARERLTTTRARGTANASPAWSPDGSWIAFVRTRTDAPPRSQTGELRAIGAGGGGEAVLARNAVAGGLAWAPSGEEIVFVREVSQGARSLSQLVALRLGAGERTLTGTMPSSYDSDPAFSPSGEQVAFTRVALDPSSVRATVGVYLVGADGSNLRQLSAEGASPTWSPDGTRIAFTSTRDLNGRTCFHECTPNSELYVMNADGSGQRRLTFTKGDEAAPSWSPDGARIAFSAHGGDPTSHYEIWTLKPDGSCAVRLTNSAASNERPAFSPGASGPPAACGTPAPAAVNDLDVSAARGFRRYPLRWLGKQFDGLLLTDFRIGDTTSFIYDDCGRPSGRCGQTLEIQATPICARNPTTYGRVGRLRRTRDVLRRIKTTRIGDAIVYSDREGGADVYTGRVTLTIFGAGRRLRRIVRGLRPLSGGRRPLAAPRFPASNRSPCRIRPERG